MSNARSPRDVCSTTIGTNGLMPLLRCLRSTSLRSSSSARKQTPTPRQHPGRHSETPQAGLRRNGLRARARTYARRGRAARVRPPCREDVVSVCNALGLFAGEGRLIVVDGVEAWKAPDVKAIAAYLKTPAPATTLALVAAELKKDAPLAKAVRSTGGGN